MFSMHSSEVPQADLQHLRLGAPISALPLRLTSKGLSLAGRRSSKYAARKSATTVEGTKQSLALRSIGVMTVRDLEKCAAITRVFSANSPKLPHAVSVGVKGLFTLQHAPTAAALAMSPELAG